MSEEIVWVVHSVVRWDSLLSNALVLWVVELLSGVFFFCGIPRVLEAVLGDSVCVEVLLFRGRRSRGREKGRSKRRRKRETETEREESSYSRRKKRREEAAAGTEIENLSLAD